METEPITPAAREAVERLLDEPCSIGSLSARGVVAGGFAETALRALQKYDEVNGASAEARGRFLLIEAETALGEILGLTCTGVKEADGFYDHSGETCPVHEWLVPSDAEELGAETRAGG